MYGGYESSNRGSQTNPDKQNVERKWLVITMVTKVLDLGHFCSIISWENKLMCSELLLYQCNFPSLFQRTWVKYGRDPEFPSGLRQLQRWAWKSIIRPFTPKTVRKWKKLKLEGRATPEMLWCFFMWLYTTFYSHPNLKFDIVTDQLKHYNFINSVSQFLTQAVLGKVYCIRVLDVEWITNHFKKCFQCKKFRKAP